MAEPAAPGYFPTGRIDQGDIDPQVAVERFRDLLLTRIGEDTAIVVACDSSGAIGNKPLDHLQWPGHEVGKTAVKVPIMEVLAAGATPLIVVDALSVEMNPTGLPILEGIKEVLALLDAMPVLTGSDEVNMPTQQTGIGVTVIAVLQRHQSRLASSQLHDEVYAVGLPLGGRSGSTLDSDEDGLSVAGVQALLAVPQVREVLPVGSKGLRYEANELARSIGATFVENPDPRVDMVRSAGSCSTAVVTLPVGTDPHVLEAAKVPVNMIGRLA